MDKRYLELSTSDLITNMVTIVKEPIGCRFIQSKLHDISDLINEPIFLMINKHIVELSLDPSGNFFIQRLLEYLNEKNLGIVIYKSIKKYFFTIALNPYGTRVIQKLIDITLDKPQHLKALITHIQEHILQLMINSNSIHIIHKLVITVPIHCQFIYDCIYDNIINISMDKTGCCIVQKCFEAGNNIQRSEIINLILNFIIVFMTDHYASFVLQHIIALRDQLFLNSLIFCFKGNYIYLCKQKYSSNILEKVKRKFNLVF
jgi:hypothetical protein